MNSEDISSNRASMYAFLSRMFVEEPPFELAEDLVRGKFPLPDVSSSNEDFADGINVLKEFMTEEKDVKKLYESMCAEFTRLFLGPVPFVFPYESMYIDGSIMAKSLLKVKNEYRAAGFSRAQGFHEPEDHIAMELGFMGNLCQKVSKENLKVQREFLDKHLSKWAPGFCNELCEKSRSDFYKGIGKLTKGFLDFEKNLIEELLSVEQNHGKRLYNKKSNDC